MKIKVFFFDNDGEKWPASKSRAGNSLSKLQPVKIWSSDKCTQRVEAAKLCKSTCPMKRGASEKILIRFPDKFSLRYLYDISSSLTHQLLGSVVFLKSFTN